MSSLAKSDAVPVAFVLIGVAIATTLPAIGAIWITTWVGTLLLLVGTRHRFPRFIPRKAPAVLPNIDPSRVEGTPTAYGWWWMFFPFMLSTTVAPVPLMDAGSLLVFGIPCVLLLVAFTMMAFVHDRGSASVVARILAASPSERIEGVVEAVDGRFERHLTWRTWTATRHGTATVEDIHGARVTVATVTHATHGCGTREEARCPFAITKADGGNRVAVVPDVLEWAAVPEPLRPGTRPLRRVGAAEESTMRFFPVVGIETESIEAGDRIVVVAPTSEVAAGRLRGQPGAPLAVYVARGGDPLLQLRWHALTRRVLLVSLMGCVAVTVAVAWVASAGAST